MRSGPQALPVQAPPLSRQALTRCSRCTCHPSRPRQGDQASHHHPQPGHGAGFRAAGERLLPRRQRVLKGSASLCKTPRAMARARQSAAVRPISVRGHAPSRIGFCSVATANTVSPSWARARGGGETVVGHDGEALGLRLGSGRLAHLDDEQQGRGRGGPPFMRSFKASGYAAGWPSSPNSAPTSNGAARSAAHLRRSRRAHRVDDHDGADRESGRRDGAGRTYLKVAVVAP